MRWSYLRKLAISLPAAIFVTFLLVTINEVDYHRSHTALENVSVNFRTHLAIDKLREKIADLETSVRKYLATGNERHLASYDANIADINRAIEELRVIYSPLPEDLKIVSLLGSEFAKKLSEMKISIDLRKEGFDEAWRYLISNFADHETVDSSVCLLCNELDKRNDKRLSYNESEILQSLIFSRFSINIVSIICLMAFYLYLRQSNRLTHYMRREQKMLENERDRLEALVRTRTASLAELATHLQQVREDERAHLARELHDELGALLTAAKLDVARLKSKIDMHLPDVNERVHHLIETLNSGIALKRTIIENLRPSSLSNLGLRASLEILGNEFSKSSSIAVELNLESVDAPEATQLTIYRLIQESLTNIGKHAQAKNVLIQLENHPAHISIQVRDDGVGFDPNHINTPSSHGLISMRHRVEAAGGRLTVTSAPGHGTLVSAFMPRPEPALPDTVQEDPPQT